MTYRGRSRMVKTAAEIMAEIGPEEDSTADLSARARCSAGEDKPYHCPYPVQYKDLCEGHYRRTRRVSKTLTWDAPLLRRKPRKDQTQFEVE